MTTTISRAPDGRRCRDLPHSTTSTPARLRRFEEEFGREGGDRLLPEVWKKMKAAFCHGESKPKCCTGNALYSNDMFSDKPIFTEQELV